jgi:hypothetical protein
MAVVALNLLFARYSPGPVLYSDSMGYLGSARTLAGAGQPINFDFGAFTAVGYALLLSPAYLVTVDPHSIFLFAVGVNIAACASIAIAGYLLARDVFAIGHRDSLLVGALAATYPAYLLQSGQVWPEVVLAALVLWWAVVLARFLRSGSAASAAVLGVVTGFAWATHRRMAALVAVTLLVLAYAAWRRRELRAGALGATAVVVLLCAGTYVLEHWLKTRMWSAAPVNEDSTGKLAANLEPHRWGGDVLMALGEGWYVAAASLGLVVLGVVGLVRLLVVRRRLLGRGDPDGLIAVALLLAFLGTIAIGALSLRYAGGRADLFVYGRYMDEFSGVMIAVAAALVASSSRSVSGRATLLLMPAAFLLTSAAVVYGVRGRAAFAGNVQKLTIPGILGEQAVIEGRTVFAAAVRIRPITALAVAASLGLVLLIRLAPTAALAAALVGFVGFALVGQRQSLQPFMAFWNSAYGCIPAAIEQRDDPPGEIAMDLQSFDPSARNRYQFLLPRYRFLYFDDRRAAPPASLVVAPPSWAGAAARGFEPVTAELQSSGVLWERGSPTRGASTPVVSHGAPCPAPMGTG